jgi:ribosomal protein S18 acetylase RimI-like enzyme
VLTVRPAEPTDLAPVVDLHERAFCHYSVASWAVNQAARIFVARRSAGFVGFGLSERVGRSMPLEACLGASVNDPSLPIDANDTVLSALAVEPHARRNGVGRALCLARVREAREHGSARVFAHCIEGTGSLALLTSLGFEPVAFVPAYYRNGRGMTFVVLDLP